MKTLEALEFMRTTGKPVKGIPIAGEHPINHRGYYKLFQNDVVLKLLPDAPCAATVWDRPMIEYWKYCDQFDYFGFEEYDPRSK